MIAAKIKSGTMLTLVAALTAVVVFSPSAVSARATATEVVLSASFESPPYADVTGDTSGGRFLPAGWVSEGNGYYGLLDTDSGIFTTAHGTQAVWVFDNVGTSGTTGERNQSLTTSADLLDVPLTAETTYTLTFNTATTGSAIGYRVRLMAIAADGTATELAQVIGTVDTADMSVADTIEFTPDESHAPLFGQRVAVQLRKDVGPWRYRVLYDNLVLTRTTEPEGPSALVAVPGTDGGGCDHDFEITIGEVSTGDYAAFLNAADTTGEITVADGKVSSAGTGDIYCAVAASEPATHIAFDELAPAGGRFSVAADKEELPVVFVSWYGAAAYCNWKSVSAGAPMVYDSASGWAADLTVAGYRLPTEAEWYKAAAWNAETESYFVYGTGKDSVAGQEANFIGSGDAAEDLMSGRLAYASYAELSPYGIYDASGNVWEWCQTDFDESGSSRAVRGGSWGNLARDVKTTSRTGFKPDMLLNTVGFRVVVPASQL